MKATANPWDRQTGESSFWYQRFEVYRLLGPTRNLTAAVNRERVAKGQKESAVLPGSWRRTAKAHHWAKRAEAWDEQLATEAATRAEAERSAVMCAEFALDVERVRSLNQLAKTLEEWIGTRALVWLPDYKGIGNGANFEKVMVERFNAPLIEQFRQVLDDIAVEVGQRQRSVLNENIDLSLLDEDQVRRIAAGEDPKKVLATPKKARR